MDGLYTWGGKRGFAITTRGSAIGVASPNASIIFMSFGLTLGGGDQSNA
jgi:hypothetical protein